MQTEYEVDSKDKLIQKALEIGLENTMDLMTDHLLNSKEVNKDYINILRKEEEMIIQALEVLEGKNKRLHKPLKHPCGCPLLYC